MAKMTKSIFESNISLLRSEGVTTYRQ